MTDSLFADAHREMQRSLMALRLEAPGVVVDDVKAKVDAVVSGLTEALERYEKALSYMADYQMTGTEQTLHIDFQGKAREALHRV